MQNLETRAMKRYTERRRSTARRYGIGLLALLVLLCTAAALLLPAFTLEKDVFCGLEEHTHTEACYQMVPICGVEERPAHTHSDACFEIERELSCGLEESEGHTHTDACFKEEKELICGIPEDEGHTHTDACFIEEREPVCGIVEDEGHTHDENCWGTEWVLACELEENEDHQHGDACYIETPVLVCGEEEREGHTHDDSCYETHLVLNCGEEEREGHTHGESCYTANKINVCGLEESEGHTHTDECYTEAKKLICEETEDEGHTHSEACMEKKLVCEKPEHTHSLQCYSNPEADVENEAAWILSFPAFGEDATPVDRLVGIAVSQLGYHESAVNYQADENEVLRGYTRYGDFYGEPYADWNGMFVSFCLHYSEIDPAIFPAEGDAQSMIDALTEKELYIPNGTEGFLPRTGDLVFFDNIYTGTYAVRVGIVTSVDAESGVLTVMEGDSADSVAECKYAPDDTTILGYGALSEALHEEAAAEAVTTDIDTDTEDADAEDTEIKADDANTAETKTDETKTDETKTDDTKTDETKTDDTKTAETKTDDTKDDETKADDTKTAETKTAETKTDDTKTAETKTDETKTDETKTDETKDGAEDLDTGANDVEAFLLQSPEGEVAYAMIMQAPGNAPKLMMRAPLLRAGEGDGTEPDDNSVDLLTITNNNVKPTKTAFNEQERGKTLHLEFDFTIPQENLSTAKQHTHWVYDMRSMVGVDEVFSSVTEVQNGNLMSGNDIVGTFTVTPDGYFHIVPNENYLDTISMDLVGKFALTVTLNKNYSPDKNETDITFPGNVPGIIRYTEKRLEYGKTVSTAPNGGDVNNQSNVQLVEEADGEYYMYYTLQMTPKNNLSMLKITDTLNGNQTLVPESIVFSGGGSTYQGDDLTGHLNTTDTGFVLDAGSLLPNGAIAETYYTVTYKTKVDKAAVQSGNIGELKNDANFKWEGSNGDKTTVVTPEFDKELDTNKLVGAAPSSVTAQNGGSVELVKEADGEYYLYYRVTAKPNTKLSTINLTDTVGSGQEIDTSSIQVTMNGSPVTNTLTPNGQDISGTITPDGGIPANAEVVVTYRVKLTKNEDGSPVSEEKDNTATWEWTGEPETDTTKVTPKEPDPTFNVDKAAPTSAEPGAPINYTVTITNVKKSNGQYADLHDYPFHDYISDYPFTFDGTVTVTDSNGATVNGTATQGTRPTGTPTGGSFELFTYEFPEGSTEPSYTITYTVTPSNSQDLAGLLKYINRGEIGKGQDDTTTDVDYGTPDLEKNFSEWDKTNNAVVWTIHVVVPEGKTFTDLTVTEKEFTTGENQYYMPNPMTIDWDSVTFDPEITPAPVIDRTANTITFYEISQNCDITLKTRLPEGVTMEKLDKTPGSYWVHNKAELTVGGKGVTTAEDLKEYKKADYSFDKTGLFDATQAGTRPTATWTVVLNKDKLKFTPDVEPYFFDTIPEGMEFVEGTFNIKAEANGQPNHAGNQIWQLDGTLTEVPISDRELGSINLVDAMRRSRGEQNAPDGLSGVKYTVTYQTQITEEKWVEMQEQVGKYTFTNAAKIMDEGGDTLRVDSDTITYEYKDLIKKVDVGNKEGSTVKTITYRIAVNPEGKLLNNNDRVEIFDKLETNITLKTNTVKVFRGTLNEDKTINGTQIFPKLDESDPDPNVTVSYDDNSRLLRIFVPDQTPYVVEFEVIPIYDATNSTYTNTAYLHASTFDFKSTVTSNFNVDSYATIGGDTEHFTILKRDLNNLEKPVVGAKFELYEATLDENKKIIGSVRIPEEDQTKTFTSDTNGVVTFDYGFQPETLYFWKEISAPEGYMVADRTAHNFCIYHEYTREKLTDRSKLALQTEWRSIGSFSYQLQQNLHEALGNDVWQFQIEQINDLPDDKVTLKNEILEGLAEEMTAANQKKAKEFDNAVELANNIIVLRGDEGYTWNWSNPKMTAYAELKGTKYLHGRNLQEGEFAFVLNEVVGNQRVRTQLVTNNADGSFQFSDIPYTVPGVYHYEIKEYNKTEADDGDFNLDPTVLYDEVDTVEVEVNVTEDDISQGRNRIPDSQITYRKGGMVLSTADGAIFNNDVDQAAIIINKAFSGDQIPSEPEKNKLRFEVYDKETNALIATIPYSAMTAGHYYVLTEGIVGGREYLVKEILPAETREGVVCITTYTVRGEDKKGGAEASVSVPANKAARVDFENHYENEHMQFTVRKRWYKQDGENMIPAAQGPDGVSRIYFRLQRFDTTDNQWKWIDTDFHDDYPVENDYREIDLDIEENELFTVSSNTNWSKTFGESGNMPVGQYRLVEVEKAGDKWRAVSASEVVYKDQQLTVGEPVRIESKDIIDGTTDRDSTVYIYNRLAELDFVKAWQDKNGNPVDDPFTKYGIQSITFQLMKATSPDGEATPVEGKTVTIDDKDDPIHFDGLLRQNAAGEDLYYSVTEQIKFTDGIELTREQSAERFKIEPSTGVKPTADSKTITNVEQPFGITVTKNWTQALIDNGEQPEDIYVQLQAYYYSSYHAINDPNLKTDAGDGPIITTDGKYLYRIKWNDTDYEPITFSYLFRKYDGKINSDPKDNGATIEYFKFVEYVYDDATSSYKEFSDASHLVTYSFVKTGETEPSSMVNISPTENGTMTITNSKRDTTKLMVTKSWPEKKDSDKKIYYQVYLVAEDGTDFVLKMGTGNDDYIVNKTDKNIYYNESGANFYLNYIDPPAGETEGTWETAEFNFPTGDMHFTNWSSKRLAGVYVVEVGEDGTPLDNNNDGMTDSQTENWKITYTFGDDQTVSPTKPVIAGSNGTLTITNAKPTPPSIDLKIVKVDANDLNKELDQARKLVATFTLSRADTQSGPYVNMEAYKEQPTTDGELKFENLLDGYYRLVEVNAPQDYVNSSEPFDFTVKDGVLTAHDSRLVKYVTVGDRSGGGKVYTYKIGNEKGVELPATGGMGAGAYRLGGAALLLAATGLAAAPPLKRSRADRARRRKGGEGET